jgi:hypothetical protein
MHQPFTFAQLPAELLQRIFAMLPHHEHIVHALMTCKAWCAPTDNAHMRHAPRLAAQRPTSINRPGSTVRCHTYCTRYQPRAAAPPVISTWCRREVGQDSLLWATYGARVAVMQAVELVCGRRRLDSLTAEQWRQLCAHSQPCRALPCLYLSSAWSCSELMQSVA